MHCTFVSVFKGTIYLKPSVLGSSWNLKPIVIEGLKDFILHHSVFMCFLWFSQEMIIISPNETYELVFLVVTDCILCEVATDIFYTI